MKHSIAEMREGPEGYAWSRFGQPEYTNWLDESMSWKQTCYIGDWSFLWQHRLTGPDALKLISDFTVNSYKTFNLYQSKHAIHTNQDGKVIHEGVLTRFGENEFVVHGRGGFWLAYNAKQGDYDVSITREDWFIYQVSGPHALPLLQKLSGSKDLTETKYMHALSISIADTEICALRQGMAGEVGFELQGPKDSAERVYSAILDAGQEFGIRRMGGRIAMINHLEASFPTIATDYIPAIFDEDTAGYLDYFMSSMPPYAKPAYISGSYDGESIQEYYRSPVELGWGKVVTTQRDDYLGAAALAEEKENPRRVLRTLEWNREDVTEVLNSLFEEGEHYDYMEMPRDQRGFMWADRVVRDGRDIGTATSRGYSYYFRKMLSLSTLDVADAEIGTEVEIIWGAPGHRQKTIRAVVCPAPYKTDHSRGQLQ
ncbi:MAG: glycine cleavage T C-terminal barrel domain-containing protein [Micrococcaceae bacterium]